MGSHSAAAKSVAKIHFAVKLHAICTLHYNACYLYDWTQQPVNFSSHLISLFVKNRNSLLLDDSLKQTDSLSWSLLWLIWSFYCNSSFFKTDSSLGQLQAVCLWKGWLLYAIFFYRCNKLCKRYANDMKILCFVFFLAKQNTIICNTAILIGSLLWLI